MPKVGFNSKGLLVSRLKACLSVSIDPWTSGPVEAIHCSKTRMCLVKYVRAWEFIT